MRTRHGDIGRFTAGAFSGVATLFWVAALQAQINYTSFDIRTAKDIAVNQSGALWAIGADASPNGIIQRLRGTNLVAQPGGASRVAVEPSGSAWVVNSGVGLFH